MCASIDVVCILRMDHNCDILPNSALMIFIFIDEKPALPQLATPNAHNPPTYNSYHIDLGIILHVQILTLCESLYKALYASSRLTTFTTSTLPNQCILENTDTKQMTHIPSIPSKKVSINTVVAPKEEKIKSRLEESYIVA